MLAHIKSVLNFSAFRPEADDSRASWQARFEGRPTALLHIGRASLSYSIVDGKGQKSTGETMRGDLKEAFISFGPAIRHATDGGWCTVSLDSRYVITVESNLSRKKGSEEALKKDPRSVLHARYERGKRYMVTHNPETNSSLLLAYDEEHIKKVEALCQDQKLKIGRLCCGTYVLLRHALTLTNTKKGSETPFSALYIACCGGSVCVLSQDRDNWVELRSRSDVYDNDLQPLIDLIAPFHERIGPETGLVLVCDEPIAGLAESIAGVFPGREINDLTEAGLLTRLLYAN